MKLNQDSGKYILQSELRTWSDARRQRAEEAKINPSRRNTLSAFLHHLPSQQEKTHTKEQSSNLPSRVNEVQPEATNEDDDHALGPHEPSSSAGVDGTADAKYQLSSKSKSIPSHLLDGIRSTSGADTPHEMPSDDEIESYPFPSQDSVSPSTRSMATAIRTTPQRKPTPEDIERWVKDSGMGTGKQADALGDEPEEEDLEAAEKEDKSLGGSVY
jgi:hypothetical protein